MGLGRGQRRGQGLGRADPADLITRTTPAPNGQNRPRDDAPTLVARARDIVTQLEEIHQRIAGSQTRSPSPADLLARTAEQPPQREGSIHSTIASVNDEKCTACAVCLSICPEQAISLDGVAKVDPLLCTGCGICVSECPEQAISLIEAARHSDSGAD